MQADPTLSRHAAIKRVAGEGNVRRIEMKMSRRNEAAPPTHGEIAIQIGSTPPEMMLVAAERQALAGSGEKVRWSAFNDVVDLEERHRVAMLGPDFRAKIDRMDRYCLHALGFIVVFFLGMVAMLPFGLFWRVLGVPAEEVRSAVSPVVLACVAGLIPSILAAIVFALRAERITDPLDRMSASDLPEGDPPLRFDR